jgi:hypothetical protein
MAGRRIKTVRGVAGISAFFGGFAAIFLAMDFFLFFLHFLKIVHIDRWRRGGLI